MERKVRVDPYYLSAVTERSKQEMHERALVNDLMLTHRLLREEKYKVKICTRN